MISDILFLALSCIIIVVNGFWRTISVKIISFKIPSVFFIITFFGFSTSKIIVVGCFRTSSITFIVNVIRSFFWALRIANIWRCKFILGLVLVMVWPVTKSIRLSSVRIWYLKRLKAKISINTLVNIDVFNRSYFLKKACI